MFTGPDPVIHSILNGILAVAGVIYAASTLAIIAAIRADPARAAAFARLAAIAKAGPPLVGLACLGFILNAVDLRPGHEADIMSRWPALLPQLAALSAGAAFLTGLLAGARPIRTAFATGGPVALLSALVWVIAGTLLLVGWRDDPENVKTGLQAAPAGLVTFFKYLIWFPIVTVAVAGAAASIGRTLHGLLGLPADAKPGDGAPGPAIAPTAVPTAAASPVPTLRVPAPHVPTPSVPPPPASAPSPAPPAGAPGRATKRQAVAWRRAVKPVARWPSVLLAVLGLLMMVPAACDVLTPKARLVSAEPAGGAMLSAAPSDVGLTFADALSPSSRLRVRRTVTLDGAGREESSGGTPVAEASGSSALSVDQRTLRVRLPMDLPGGLYLVEWTTLRARGGERYGDLYFGVGMKVPSFIRDAGAARESDPYATDRREVLAGGVICLLLALLARGCANAMRGR